MRVASGSLGRRQLRLIALLLLLPGHGGCQYLFGDFSEEPPGEPGVSGGNGGSGGDQGTPAFCAEGTSACEGSQLLACVDGFLSFRQDCETPERCDDSGAGRCLLCVEGEFQCIDEKSSHRCVGGEWVAEPDCEDGLSCDEELERCAACRAGDGVCAAGGLAVCRCLPDQSGWEVSTCALGCKDEGLNDHCIDGISTLGGPLDACSGIGD
jgi:hypothetical protein